MSYSLTVNGINPPGAIGPNLYQVVDQLKTSTDLVLELTGKIETIDKKIRDDVASIKTNTTFKTIIAPVTKAGAEEQALSAEESAPKAGAEEEVPVQDGNYVLITDRLGSEYHQSHTDLLLQGLFQPAYDTLSEPSLHGVYKHTFDAVTALNKIVDSVVSPYPSPDTTMLYTVTQARDILDSISAFVETITYSMNTLLTIQQEILSRIPLA